MFSTSTNKRRLYIAFFHRESTQANTLKWHTALLITPKNPHAASDQKNSNLFHVVNRIDNSTKEDTWYFEPRSTRSRTHMLGGVMLLGKVPNDISNNDLEKVLSTVPRQKLVREDLSWRCRHWVWRALAVRILILSVPSSSCESLFRF